MVAPRSRPHDERVTQAKSDPTLLVLLAAIGIVGLLVARRYGVAHVFRTVNQALGIARVGRTARPSAARPTRRRPARRVPPTVIAFSKPGYNARQSHMTHWNDLPSPESPTTSRGLNRFHGLLPA